MSKRNEMDIISYIIVTVSTLAVSLITTFLNNREQNKRIQIRNTIKMEQEEHRRKILRFEYCLHSLYAPLNVFISYRT